METTMSNPNYWITDSQDEVCIEELLRDADQIYIPIFQRPYVWRKKEFDDLIRDITSIQTEVEKSQFLGAIVSYERPRTQDVVGRLRLLDIVDGQQRLLTLYIFVMALSERIAHFDKDIAHEAVREFLLLPPRRGLDINTRIVPGYEDRNQFRALWDKLNTPEILQNELSSNPPLAPAPSGGTTGNLVTQYSRISRFIQNQLESIEEPSRTTYLRSLLDLVTSKLTFVHLKLNDGSVAMKIFERLNFRGVRVGISDLVRNEVFSRIGNDPTAAIRLHQNDWIPFIRLFLGNEDSFFFPYCLIHDSNIKKSELFSELRRIWSGLTPIQVINHMQPYQKPFMAVNSGVVDDYPDEVKDAILNLNRMNSPSSTYPFLMKVIHEYSNGSLTEDSCVDILSFIEAFLVRRAIIGYEPTGLHALFKGLWNEVADEPTTNKIIEVIDSRPTIQRPTDTEVISAIKIRPLANAKICNYLLVEYDKALPGDNPNQPPTIEHVLPDSYDQNGPWASIFSRDQHKSFKDTWANLIPLSHPLNSSLQKSEYSRKRERYLLESMFVTSRVFADRYDTWNPSNLESRAEELAQWAINRWPYR